MAMSEKDKRGVGLIAIAALVMVGFFAAKLANDGKGRPGPDGCIGTPSANTVIVLDHSEMLTEQTRQEIVARAIAHVEGKSGINERVAVFSVSELSKKHLHPAFSRCKPAQDGNRMVENVAALKKKYLKEFVEPLRAALNVAPTDGKESPVAQALIDVSLTQYLRGDRNSLLLFSDLLEHVPAKFSLYSCTDPDRVVAMFRDSRKGAQERPSFKNTSVFLHVIPRTDAPKGALRCRDKLWPWIVGDNEGSGAGVDFNYLPGV